MLRRLADRAERDDVDRVQVPVPQSLLSPIRCKTAACQQLLLQCLKLVPAMDPDTEIDVLGGLIRANFLGPLEQ